MRIDKTLVCAALCVGATACGGPEADLQTSEATPGSAQPEIVHEAETASEARLPLQARLAAGEKFEADARMLAKLDLESGSSLRFVELAPGEVGVLESIAPGAASISAVESIGRDSTPADVFFAFSNEGVPVPPAILAAGPISSDLQVQGWAKPLVQLAPAHRAACNNNDIRDFVESFNYNDRGSPLYRFNKSPNNSGLFNGWTETWGTFYGYTATWSDVDRFLGYFALCVLDSYQYGNYQNKAHPPVSDPYYSNPHLGPMISYTYRTSGSSTWKTAFFDDLGSSDVGHSFNWHFFSGTNWDWRLKVDYAAYDDKFDIVTAVEDL